MRFIRPWSYLVSFVMPASGFAAFFVLCFFFIFMACAFIGSLAFRVFCAAGPVVWAPVVWAEATDTLPTRAAQHAATIRLRILISRLVKERPITAPSWKGSIPGTARDSRSNEPGGNALSGMPKSKPTPTGPMSTQPVGRGSIMPIQALPLMPTAGKATEVPQPKKQPTRTEAVRAAKAKRTRRESLRKQRSAQKGLHTAR